MHGVIPRWYPDPLRLAECQYEAEEKQRTKDPDRKRDWQDDYMEGATMAFAKFVVPKGECCHVGSCHTATILAMVCLQYGIVAIMSVVAIQPPF